MITVGLAIRMIAGAKYFHLRGEARGDILIKVIRLTYQQGLDAI
jgi:hypothetical protein